MSFIGQVQESQASPQLKQLYEQIRQSYGFLPNYFTAQGSAPAAIEGQLALGDAIIKDGALPTKLKEQIGLVVSGLNTSSYCIGIHMEVLRRLGVEKPLGRKLVTDYASAPVSEKELAIFRFADKLTLHPADVSQADVDAVRQAGWDDAAILETVLAAAWFNFINRMSLGLGLVADF